MTAAVVGIVLALVAAIGAWMRKAGKDAHGWNDGYQLGTATLAVGSATFTDAT